MSKILLETSHRPWPLPEGPWTWRQAWNNSLFVHYRAHTNELRSLIPPELEIQEFDGTSWIGVVAFHMNDVMKRPFPNVPWFSNFLELNVRLYVTHKGKPGVWFLSLDATNPLVVWGGRQFYNIPYRNADISYSDSSGVVRFTSQSHDDYERFDVRYCGATLARAALSKTF